MRRLRAKAAPLAAVTALTATLAGCGLSSAATSTSIGGAASGTPITVGISLPLTGDFAADGLASEQGYQLWASDVNAHGGLLGRPVNLIIRDDKSNPDTAATDYQTLIASDHVNFILAPFSTLLTDKVIPVAEQHHYVLPAGSAGGNLVYLHKSPWFFSTNVPVAFQMQPFTNWVLSLPPSERPKTAAYAMIDDPFADPPVQTAHDVLTLKGIRSVFYNGSKPIGVATTQAKTTARIQAVADKIAGLHPNMVVLGTVDVPSVRAFIEEFKAKGYNPKILIAAAGPDQGQAFIGAVGNDAIGVMVPNGWYGGYDNALSHVMVQQYIAKYGGVASGINADVAEAYSAGQILQAGVEGTKGFSNQSIQSYLHANTMQTVLGPVKFDKVGKNTLVENSAFIFQWQQGERFVQVLPPGTDSKKVTYPKPGWSG